MCQYANVPIGCAMKKCTAWQLAHWHIGTLAYWHIGTLANYYFAVKVVFFV